MHRRDARVELAERAEQLVDVDVLRPVHRRELAEDVFEVVDRAVRLAVVEQQPVGEKAAQRRLELVVMRVDEAGHDDPAARVDHAGAGRPQVRADGDDLLAFDQHVGLDEIAHARVHRHDVAAADHVAPPLSAAVARCLGASCAAAAGRAASRSSPEAATPVIAAVFRKSRRVARGETMGFSGIPPSHIVHISLSFSR